MLLVQDFMLSTTAMNRAFRRNPGDERPFGAKETGSRLEQEKKEGLDRELAGSILGKQFMSALIGPDLLD